MWADIFLDWLCTISSSIFAIKIKFNCESATYVRLFTALKQSNMLVYNFGCQYEEKSF